MADLAQIGGVRSIFCLNPRSEHYNLFSREGLEAIQWIEERGHEIGLHCDYRRDGPDLDVKLFVERELLLFGLAVRPMSHPLLVSFHMPGPSVLWKNFEGFKNAYAPEWEGRYLSDSRGQLPDVDRISDDMQINLHPEWWM